MRVFVVTDVEGCAGVASFTEQGYPTGKYYEETKKLLTGEVNAAVEGMLGEGVDDILILDLHGPGGICYEGLHPAVELMHGRPWAPREVRDEVLKEYDVCMIIGQHAMAGNARGTMNHTQSSKEIDYYKLNGKPIGEIAQVALYYGAMDIPLIYLTGDDAACREAEDLVPGIVTACVKKSLGRCCAISVSMEESHRRIRQGAAEAIRRHSESPIAPLKWPGPYVLEKRFFHTDVTDAVASARGVERVDGQTVRICGDDIKEVIYA